MTISCSSGCRPRRCFRRSRPLPRNNGVVSPAPLDRFSIRPLSPEELSGRFGDQVLWVFSGALGFPRGHGRVLSFGDTLRRHAAYPGFLAFGAFNLRGRLVGFTYGYTSQPGLWWREQVAALLTPAERHEWFSDAF